MIKIGLVGIDTSHPLGFAQVLRDKGIKMKYEYVYNDGFRQEEELNWFIKQFDLKGSVSKIEDMVDEVDIGFIQSCNWERHLDQAMPFIEKGKPVFLDKPLVGSIKDIIRIEKLVENGAKIYGSSSARYAKEIQDFLKIPIEERGEIVSIFGTCGVDEFNYGIHIVEILSELSGSCGKEVQYIGKGSFGNEDCEMFSVEFKNGIRGVYYTYLNRWQPFHITIMTTKTTYSIQIDSSQIYEALLRRIADEYNGVENSIVSVDALVDCTKIMLCGKKSRDEKNGQRVSIAELEENDKFDGDQFEEKYSSSATVIYKD